MTNVFTPTLRDERRMLRLLSAVRTSPALVAIIGEMLAEAIDSLKTEALTARDMEALSALQGAAAVVVSAQGLIDEARRITEEAAEKRRQENAAAGQA